MAKNEKVKSSLAKSNYSTREFTFLRENWNENNKMKAIALQSSIILRVEKSLSRNSNLQFH